MSAFEIALLIVNEKMYRAGMIDERTKEKIDVEIQKGLNKQECKDIIM